MFLYGYRKAENNREFEFHDRIWDDLTQIVFCRHSVQLTFQIQYFLQIIITVTDDNHKKNLLYISEIQIDSPHNSCYNITTKSNIGGNHYGKDPDRLLLPQG